MKTIYKANGKTFSPMDEIKEYETANGWHISDTEKITYKGKKVVLCNLKSN